MDVREKLVELIFDSLCRHIDKSCKLAENIADDLVSNGVTAQEWIPVTERLPDETGRYLAVKKRIAPDNLGGNRTDIVILRFFVDNGFKMPTHIPDWINEEINDEVTHWMPMPEPPKGE